MPTNEELRLLHERAISGPYEMRADTDENPECYEVWTKERGHGPVASCIETAHDAKYIVAACNELPRLLDEVADLTKDRDRYKWEREKLARFRSADSLEKELAAKDRRIERLRAAIVRDHDHPALLELALIADDRAAKEGANPDANQR